MYDVDMDYLIALVEKRPVLWDKTFPTYKDRVETKNAWKEIFLLLRSDFDELEDHEKNEFGTFMMKKWTNVRDSFKKSCKREKGTTTRSASSNKTYVFNNQMQFLLKPSTDRPADESVSKDSILATQLTKDSSSSDIQQSHAVNEQFFVSVKIENETSQDIAENVKQDRKRKLDPTELKITELLKKIPEAPKEIPPDAPKVIPYTPKAIPYTPKAIPNTPNTIPDRHLSFFKGISPSLSYFDDDDILEFQMGVLNTIKTIKQRKKLISTSRNPSGGVSARDEITQTESQNFQNMGLPMRGSDTRTSNVTSSATLRDSCSQEASTYDTIRPFNQLAFIQTALPVNQYYDNTGHHFLVTPHSPSEVSQGSTESIDFAT